jgi:plastocyanin
MRRTVPRSIPSVLAIVVAVLGAAVVAACSPGGAPSPTAPISVDPSAPRVVAVDLAFTTPAVSVPAGRPFELVFDNQENLPHNVAIQAPGGGDLFTGELFNGPAVRVYSVPTLAAGTYRFICSVHPEMVGELTAR